MLILVSKSIFFIQASLCLSSPHFHQQREAHLALPLLPWSKSFPASLLDIWEGQMWTSSTRVLQHCGEAAASQFPVTWSPSQGLVGTAWKASLSKLSESSNRPISCSTSVSLWAFARDQWLPERAVEWPVWQCFRDSQPQNTHAHSPTHTCIHGFP